MMSSDITLMIPRSFVGQLDNRLRGGGDASIRSNLDKAPERTSLRKILCTFNLPI